MKKLVLFTQSYPFGIGEEWKTTELRLLAERFSVTVVPHDDAGGARRVPPVDGVRYEEPLFCGPPRRLRQLLPGVLASRSLPRFLRELVESRAFARRRHLLSWLAATAHIVEIAAHPTVRRLLAEAGADTVFYFYWARGTCDAWPFVERRDIPSFVRFHRFDLYEDQNDGYIPYRRALLRAITVAAPCSRDGWEHLLRRDPESRTKLRVCRIGTVSAGLSSESTDGILRIVSCSKLVPVKRVELLARALRHCTHPIEWTHLGDGPLLDELRRAVERMPPHVRVSLRGWVASRAVLSSYVQQPIDLFVNVSASEGVPVSIMEALSAGIPVLATDVGGTREIVDDSVGRLLPADVTPEALARAIGELAASPPPVRRELRQNAYARYQRRCDARVLAQEVADLLDGLLPPDAAAQSRSGSKRSNAPGGNA